MKIYRGIDIAHIDVNLKYISNPKPKTKAKKETKVEPTEPSKADMRLTQCLNAKVLNNVREVMGIADFELSKISDKKTFIVNVKTESEANKDITVKHYQTSQHFYNMKGKLLKKHNIITPINRVYKKWGVDFNRKTTEKTVKTTISEEDVINKR